MSKKVIVSFLVPFVMFQAFAYAKTSQNSNTGQNSNTSKSCLSAKERQIHDGRRRYAECLGTASLVPLLFSDLFSRFTLMDEYRLGCFQGFRSYLEHPGKECFSIVSLASSDETRTKFQIFCNTLYKK